jgi:hypothetical protein
MSFRVSDQNKVRFVSIVLAILFIVVAGIVGSTASAQDAAMDRPSVEPTTTAKNTIEVISPYLSIEYITLQDGTQLSRYLITGPPQPPPEYQDERAASVKSIDSGVILPDFPSFSWVFGCSAVSGAMIAGYYDRNGYPNMYTGPTNGGVMPITDTSWPTWDDGDPNYPNYPNNPLIASHNGVDGRSIKGSIDDYWVRYGSVAIDPFINNWAQHTWETAIGDFMKTSQSTYGNTDGSTSFYFNPYSNAKLTCSNMENSGIAAYDGTYGRKLFYEARGYTVTDCYNQNTDNNVAGGFSLANFQAEINAGNPVLLNLAGHSIVGYGYDGSTVYIRDTWSNNPAYTPTMQWGGSYSGMELLSVSVVRLASQSSHNHSFLPLVTKPNPTNQAPTDILLSGSSIAENQLVNTVIGTLSTNDPNAGDTFTYSLVNGAGDIGNSSFNIYGNQLRSSVIFDAKSQNSISIRLRSTDQGGLFYEKAFTITIHQNPILNGDFDQGSVYWTEYSTHGWPLILNQADLPITTYNGTWAVWLGGDYDEISYIEQQVTVPVGQPYLSYMHSIQSQDICGYDFGKVLVNGVVATSYDLCINNNTSGWVQKVVNLSAYAGQSVRIQLRAECDSVANSNLFIDNVTFQSSSMSTYPPLEINPVGGASVLKREVIAK